MSLTVSSLSDTLQIEPLAATPEAVFAQFRSRPYAFWLDSAGGPPGLARWSFLGADPFALLEATEDAVTLTRGSGSAQLDGDPVDALRTLLSEYALPPHPNGIPFIGGGVGWFSYDLARRWERLPTLAATDFPLPQLRVAFYATVFAYDHTAGRMWRITHPTLPRPLLLPPVSPSPRPPISSPPRSTLSREAYRRAVERIRDYIAAGDIYQANLTQRFARPLAHDPADLYLRLRSVNPAPFAAYLGFGDVAVMSASPERFLAVEAATRRVETRPIKGTRPRSPDPDEDRRLADALRASEKDRAENLMIVDVHRNDLGRVCEIGSIAVPTLWGLESYATVHHLVSTVTGLLPDGVSPLDLLRAAFPAGSITGAPKLRAMEIIEELEPVRRGLYTGSIGYVGWDGGMDLSVAIRTLVAQDGWVHYGVGGGIVADSEPDAEYQETLDKARGLEAALEAEDE